MNKGISHGPGGFMINFTHYQGGLFHGMAGHVNGGPEAAETRSVRRRNLNKCGINLDNAGLNQPGNFGKWARDHIDTAGGNFFAGHPPGKKGFQSILMVLISGDGDGRSKTHQLNEFQIPEVSGIGIQQAFDQCAGLRYPGSQENLHSGFNLGKDFPGGNQL